LFTEDWFRLSAVHCELYAVNCTLLTVPEECQLKNTVEIKILHLNYRHVLPNDRDMF